ncbi:MAG: cobalamin-binding protein [endosymbiont of Galathealinum brachiosum]|uniref:Cobalamin-binding protein n=1 Tax=endosymbiont of Galathealinum brachiosum TaxID=2200906 RepID=A0A370D9J9_9GAMM|nr:MAG: cobalamin-binding protein [endosymbiont of Galathealinum brachiosum]
MKLKVIFILIFSVVSTNALSEIVVTDDSGKKITFDKPVKRIISLAPHVAELLFAAGADKQVLGTVSFSDYPERAKKIPRIGSYKKVDKEKILALQPELIIYWKSGNPVDMINGIKDLGIPIFNNEPDEFEDVAESLRVLGKLLGTEHVAEVQANEYLKRLKSLRKKYSDKVGDNDKIRVFYQVWNQPLMTINKDHLVNDVIEFCGGVNVFADMDNIAPTIDMESVMKKNPDVILAGMAKGREDWLSEWLRWEAIEAVKNNHVYAIDAGLIVRQTPRILDGAEKICEIFSKYKK